MDVVFSNDLQNAPERKDCRKLSYLFHNSAAAHPDNTAIVFCHEDTGTKRVTYKELQAQVRRVSAELSRWCHDPALDSLSVDTGHNSQGCGDLRSQGCDDSSSGTAVIGILCSPGITAVTCLLACLDNFAYWYMSLDLTEIEIKLLCSKVCPKRILIQEEYLNHIKNVFTVIIIASFQIFGHCFKIVSINTSTQSIFRKYIVMRDLAYVITTSGSTGSPKIVYVPTSCIIPNITDLVSVFQLNSHDCILAAAPLTFDPSVVDMFMTFQVGAALVIPSHTLLRTPRLLVSIMVEVGITVLQATPSLLFSLGKERLKQTIFSCAYCLKILALGGEIFPKLSVLMEIIGEDSQVRIFNLYGITEVSCWSTLHEVTNGKHVSKTVTNLKPHGYQFSDMTPIGSPLTSTQVQLLDKVGNDVEEGKVGEIYVGGNRRWCWVDDVNNNINNTAQAFLRSTGDKGVLKDGNIYCLGRISKSLVKRNGQKVSLEEIAVACQSLEYVAVCHVAVYEEGKMTAFVLPVTGQNSVDKDVLWSDMRKLLSPGKLPDNVVVVSEMPFNNHGKIDSHQLLNLHQKSVHLNQRKYKHQTLEHFFRDLWLIMTGCKDVTPCDNFIKSGGNSLNAVQFIEELQQFLGFKIPDVLDALLNDSYKKVLHLVNEVCYFKREDQDYRNLKNKKIKLQARKHIHSSPISKITSLNTHSEIWHRHDESDKPQNNIRLSDKNQHPKVATIISRRGVRSIRPPQTSERHLEHMTLSEWRYRLGKCIDSSPLLVEYCDGRVLVMVGSHSFRFCCVNGNTGEMLWDITLGDRVESSPAVSFDGRHVFAGCYDGKLYCICVSDGTLAWEYETEGRGEIKSSPIVDEETDCVIFGAHDKKLHCLSSDGTLRWTAKISEGSVFSSPCILKDIVFVGTLDGALARVDKETGKLQWRIFVGSPLFSSPAVSSEGVVVGSVEGLILSYSLTGQKLWEFKAKSTVFSSPFVLQMKDGREIVAVGSHDHNVYFLSGKGELLNEFEGSSPVYATPFLSYVDDPNSFRAVICETSGKICVINVTLARKCSDSKQDTSKNIQSSSKEPRTQLHSYKPDLELEWERKLDGEIFSSPVWYQNKMYVGCRDDHLYCIAVIPSCLPNNRETDLKCKDI